MDCPKKDYNLDKLTSSCPLITTCVVGNFAEEGCPAYDGCAIIDGMAAVICKSSDKGHISPCPQCMGQKFSRTTCHDVWLCRDCGFYVIPGSVKVMEGTPRSGRSVVIKCNCGAELRLFWPINRIADMDSPDCPDCGQTLW